VLLLRGSLKYTVVSNGLHCTVAHGADAGGQQYLVGSSARGEQDTHTGTKTDIHKYCGSCDMCTTGTVMCIYTCSQVEKMDTQTNKYSVKLQYVHH